MSNPPSGASACRFCAIAEGSGRGEADHPIAETDSYFAIPTLGSLVPGWVLICPKVHRANMASAYCDAELCAFRMNLARVLSERFGLPVRMFEHGAVANGSAMGCGVDHAHVHLVPTAVDISKHRSDLETVEWRTVPSSRVQELAERFEYLYYSNDASAEDPIGELALPARPTAQYFRRALASAIDRPGEYDYRVHPYIGNAIKTAQVLTQPT